MTKSKLLEMNNVGIVVENLDNAISFFTEIGLKLEGQAIDHHIRFCPVIANA